MTNKTNDRRSVLMIVSSMLIFGTIGIFRRYIPLSSPFLAFSRGILGGLCLLFFIRFKRKAGGEKIPFRLFLQLSLTGALIGFNWILLFEAYNYTSVAAATLCYYMQPTIVVLLSPIIFREKLTLKKAVCAAAAILGMVLVSGVPGQTGSGLPGGSTRGVMLGLGAAVIYASVIIMNKKLPGIDAYQKTMIQLFSAGLVLIPYLVLTKGFIISGSISPLVILLLLIVGIIHTGIAYLLYFASMDGLTVQSIALLSYIDPVSALLFSALLLGERLGILSMIGAAMIIGSAILSEMDPAEQQNSRIAE